MKKLFCAFTALAATGAALSILTAAADPPPDRKAVAIAHRMMQAMGGEAAWQQARYVRFDFIVKVRGQMGVGRAYLWDKRTGRYRLEDKSATDSPAVVLFNTRDGQGTAYVAGRKLEGAAAAKAVKGAYRAYRMDADWLALPWNWLAPGVHLKYIGEKSVKDQACDVVEVKVDEPSGADPMRYTTYVSRKSHLMEHWSVGPDNSLWDWQYVTVGGIQLGGDHTNAERHASISTGNAKVLDKVDDAFLTDPAHRLSLLTPETTRGNR